MARATVERAVYEQTITFSSGTSSGPVSTVADIRKAEYIGIILSTAFGSSQITFQVSPTSGTTGTWYDLYIGSSQASLTVSTAATRAYVLDLSLIPLAPFPFMRLVSASTGETAGRTITVCTK